MEELNTTSDILTNNIKIRFNKSKSDLTLERQRRKNNITIFGLHLDNESNIFDDTLSKLSFLFNLKIGNKQSL